MGGIFFVGVVEKLSLILACKSGLVFDILMKAFIARQGLRRLQSRCRIQR